jgi:transcriptional regulator with XRE-family HTH domain
MDDKTLGERIKSRRERMGALHGGFSQEYVAALLGLTRAGYAHWEQGRRGVSAPDLARLAKILQVPVVYFYDDDPPADHDPNSDAPTDDEEGEVLRYFHGIPPMMRPAAKAMLKGLMDAEPDYEEGRVFGRKAE